MLALLEKAAENILAAEELVRTRLYAIATSRAYYAMFYAAEALLVSEGREFSSHGAVHAAFGEHFAKTGKLNIKFHRYLVDAFRERQAADYDAPSEVSRSDANTQIKRAKEFVEAVRKFLSS